MNLLVASLAANEPRLGADERALEPCGPKVSEVACPVVSHRLCDPIEEVVDSTSRTLIGLAPLDLRTCRDLGCLAS